LEAALAPFSTPTVHPDLTALNPSNPRPALALPSPLGFVRALVGFGLLGGVAALGAGDAAGGIAPTGVVSATGALALTVPALLVAHPFLELRAAPQALLTAVARPFVRCGELALALVPVMLLFRATSGLAELLLCLFLLGIAGLGFSLAIRHLLAAEAETGSGVWASAKMAALVWGWAGLAGLIGARLGLGLLLGG
jgi:hypothetical protein